MTEAEFQAGVIELARVCGWRVHHTRPARTNHGWRTPITGDVGFPDLTLARRGRLIFVELKSETGRVRAEQQAWLVALSACAEVFVWRPSEWPTIEEVLRRETPGLGVRREQRGKTGPLSSAACTLVSPVQTEKILEEA